MNVPTIIVILATKISVGYANASPPSVTMPPKTTTMAQVKPRRDPAQFPAYVAQLKSQAVSKGISQITVDDAFANVYFLERVMKSDRHQLEKRIALDDYLTRVLPPWKIEQGQAFCQRYSQQLARVTARYGVSAHYIVALWGGWKAVLVRSRVKKILFLLWQH